MHGTITAVLAGIGAEEPSDIDRLRSALADGKLLSGSEVDALEAKLKNSPGDWPTRIELTSYYSSSATLRMSKSQIIAARRRHILWAIENRAAEPEIFSMPAFQISTRGPLADSEGVKEAEQAWRRAVTNSAQNSDVLLNAAAFFGDSDPLFAEWVLLKAKSQARDDVRWNEALGWLYATALVSSTDLSFADHGRVVLTTSDDADLLTAAVPVLAWPDASLSGTPAQIRFLRPKYLELAEELAERAESLDPQNPYRLVPLLQALTIRTITAEAPEEKAEAKKREYEAAKRFNDFVIDPAFRLLLLPMLAELAFDAND